MKTAVIYARYSSERQTEQSIEGQIRECTEYAHYNNIAIVDTYVDRAMSGTNDNRSDFQRMLKDCSKQAWDMVLVYKLDRFSRNKYEMAIHRKTLRDNGIKLVSAKENIPDSPEGIILESLLEGMAEYYSAELSQKVKRGMKESRIKGNFTGGNVIYGYKVVNKKVTIDEPKAEIVRRIFTEYASGKYVKDIVADLTKEGIYNKGKPFAINTIYNTLRNEKYSGIMRFKDELFPHIYPRIIPESLFNIVKTRMKNNAYGSHSKEVIYLLKNKAKCGHCGKSMIADCGTARNGTKKRYYTCTNRKKGKSCKLKLIRKEVLEDLVINTTTRILNNSNIVNKLSDKILEIHNARNKEESLLNLMKEQKIELTRKLDNLLTALEKGICNETTQRRMETIEEQLKNIEKTIAYEESKEKSSLSKEKIARYFAEALKKEPFHMIELLIDKILVYDDKIEIFYKYTYNNMPDDKDHQAFSFYNGLYTFQNNNSTAVNNIKIFLFF